MKKEETRFTEQSAPLKNTDKAYVKVSRDKDVQPDRLSQSDEEIKEKEHKGEPEQGTLRHR